MKLKNIEEQCYTVCMISRYTYQGLSWIDIESPSAEEIHHITEEFKLPSLVSEEMAANTLRSKVDLYKNFIYLILHFPVSNKVTNEPIEQEIDFIIAKNYFITIRYEGIDPVHEFAKHFEASSLTERDHEQLHGGLVFMQMMKQFYKASLRDLEEITLDIKHIERKIFTSQESSLVRAISHISRKLLDFKQAIRFHHEILKSYESASKRLFGEGYGYYAEVTISEFNKVDSVLESNRDVLSELQRTHDSLLSTKSNEILRTFTIMTFVMLPLTLITGVFSMNTIPDLVFIKNIRDFYFVLGALILSGVVMFIFFKVRKWI